MQARQQIAQVRASEGASVISLDNQEENEKTKQEILSKIDLLISRIDTFHIDDKANE